MAHPLELAWLSPEDLEENPLNWRLHPFQQRLTIASMLDRVGWAGALLYNRRTGRLIDGHLRRELAIERGDEAVPVLIGDWSEEQERRILALLDPLAVIAEPDPTALQELASIILRETDDPALEAAVYDVCEIASLKVELPTEAPPSEFDILDPEPLSNSYLTVLCRDDAERDAVLSALGVNDPDPAQITYAFNELPALAE